MSLIKVLPVGDELIFELEAKAAGAKSIKLVLVERAGRAAVLKISADRSIPIIQNRTGKDGQTVRVSPKS